MTSFRLRLANEDLAKFVWSLFSRLASPALNFAVLLMASRVLSIEEYGLYNFLFAVGSSLGLVLVLGQHLLLLKHYRNGATASDASGNHQLLYVNAVWMAAGWAAMLACAFVIFLLSDRFVHRYDALPIAFIFACVFAISEYMQFYFRVRGEIGLALTPRENLWRIFTVAAFPLALSAGFLTTGARAMELTTLLLAVVVGYQLLRFFQIEGFGFLKLSLREIDPSQQATWTRESLLFSANTFVLSAALYLETILIGVFLGLEAAAFYFVAFRIAALLTLPVTIIDTVGIPMVSAKLQERDVPGAQSIVSLLSAASLAGTLLAFGVMMLIGQFALSMFEPSFADHFDVLAVLCIAPVIHSFFGPGTYLMMIGGGERYFLISRSLVFVVYLVALALLGINFGMIGIAVAGLVQGLAVLIICRNWTLQHVGVDTMATTALGQFRNWRQTRFNEQPKEPMS